MGVCDSGPKFYKGFSFQKGEQYFNKIIDEDISGKDPSNKNKDKIDLYFSLEDVIDPSQIYSFSITIINNARLNIETYLGDLEGRSGKVIQYGKNFEINYYFQREQILIVEPKINGVSTGNKRKITISNLIVTSQDSIIIFEGIGKLKIKCKQKRKEDISSQISLSSFQFKFELLNKIFDKPMNLPETFFVIYIVEINRIRALYKSQEFYYRNITSNVIDLEDESLMINGDMNTKLYISLYCPHINPQKPVGYGQFTLMQLENNLNMDIKTVISLESSKYGYLGNIVINYDKKEKLTFLDYLKKGITINLDIAIDYTISNNNPEDNPIPLHNTDPRYPNDYEKAIESCGSIVAFYDDDQLFPVYGFGGKPKYSNVPTSVSHCFNINFKEDPNISGINNIILAYRESLLKVDLAGPTCFSFVIDKVIQEIKYDMKNKREENHYYILLILTDGCINDSPQTRDKIVEASYLPMSIIIVGIGKADFTLMNMLDGDAEPVVNSKGEPWKRDIVQFVEFENFKKNNAVNYGTDLTEEVLKEIPKQVEEYYQKVGTFYEW